MPSLVRFVIMIIFLAGVGFGGMVALTIFVTPEEKVEIKKIPSRDLFAEKSFFDTNANATTPTGGAETAGKVGADEISDLFNDE